MVLLPGRLLGLVRHVYEHVLRQQSILPEKLVPGCLQHPVPFHRDLGSAATIIMSIDSYGSALCGLWIQVVERVLFWLYVALLHLLPSFPAILPGTMASVLASK